VNAIVRSEEMSDSVVTIANVRIVDIEALLRRYEMKLSLLAPGEVIPGSYWGEREAGLVGNSVYARTDTPVHSLLHEACHFICMDQARRESLNRDAGGDYDEENAVCYLQIVLADELSGFSRERMLSDMDAWGYTFRLGSAQAWFQQDAEDARQWLERYAVIDAHQRPTWRVRNC
jgi:hypothetical protein